MSNSCGYFLWRRRCSFSKTETFSLLQRFRWHEKHLANSSCLRSQIQFTFYTWKFTRDCSCGVRTTTLNLYTVYHKIIQDKYEVTRYLDSYIRIAHRHTRWRPMVVTETAGLWQGLSGLKKNTDVRLLSHLNILYDMFIFDIPRSWITGSEIPSIKWS